MNVTYGMMFSDHSTSRDHLEYTIICWTEVPIECSAKQLSFSETAMHFSNQHLMQARH